MLVEGAAQRMGDPYGDDFTTVEKLSKQFGLNPQQIRDILDEAATKSADDY